MAVVVVGSGMSGTFQGVQALAEGQNWQQAASQAVATTGLSLATGGLGNRMQNMSTGVRVTVGGLLDAGSSRTSSAIGSYFAPAVAPAVASPRSTAPPVRGYADFADIPVNIANDAAYVSSFCLRRAS